MDMAVRALLLLLCASSLVLSSDALVLTAGSSNVTVDVNTETGSFTIEVDGTTWFQSGNFGYQSKGTWWTTGSGNVKLDSIESIKGTDPTFGAYYGVNISWLPSNLIPFGTLIQTFVDSDAIIFTQYFPLGVSDTSINDNTDVITSFPTLGVVTSSPPIYFYTLNSWPSDPIVGIWPEGMPAAPQGGSPIIFYNGGLRSLLFSPLDNFMVGHQTPSKGFKNFAFGLNGKTEGIPTGFTHSTILYPGQGINDTFSAWGASLMAKYGKVRNTPEDDMAVKYLGYWTDNGAYYYYKTEANKTYEQTMVDVKNYLDTKNIPVRNLQLDSWWYFKGDNNGVLLWEPMPSVFPDGINGLQKQIDNIPLVLHNRYFSPNNDYIKNYTFIVEQDIALPQDKNMFLYIMGKAKTWGMIVYEQDWLITTYMGMNATQNNVTNSRRWMMDMGEAAAELNLTIQYCMPLPLHNLQAVEIQSVTQARVSDDYNPGNSQWKIGHTSMLPWALGVFPFKDDFWTTSIQPGCPYRSCVEPNPVLETIVASLSTGPVGPSDSVGNIDVELIMQTCATDGTLLKTNKPATALDASFLPLPGSTKPQIIEISDTFTQIGTNRWHYVLAAQLSTPWILNTSQIGLEGRSSMAVDYFQLAAGKSYSSFDDAHSLTITMPSTPASSVPFRYYVIAPVLQSGWVFFGEVNKFVTVSNQRVLSLSDESNQLSVTLWGSTNETVSVAFYNTKSGYFQVVSNVGTFTITCSSTKCQNQ